MGVLSHINPKRAAAHDIATLVVSRWEQTEENKRKLMALKYKDRKLFDMVMQELDKHDYRISIDG